MKEAPSIGGNQLSRESQTLARRGMAAFMRASRAAPAHTARQGALIGAYCIEKGLDPNRMWQALFKDDAAISQIVTIGNLEHARRGANATPMDSYTVKAQAISTFDVAAGYVRRHEELNRLRSPST